MTKYISYIVVLLFPVSLIAQKTVKPDTVNLKTPAVISLLDANSELGKTTSILAKIKEEINTGEHIAETDSAIRVFEHFLKSEAKEVNSVKVQMVSKFYLENASRNWLEYKTKVKEALSVLGNKISATRENQNSLDFEKKKWELTLEAYKKGTDVPRELISRINKTVIRISKVIKEVEAKQKKLIIRENRLTDMLILTNDVLERIQSLKKEQRTSLFKVTEKPIWDTKLIREEVFPVSRHLKRVWVINKKSFESYFRQRSFFWIIVVLLVEVFLFFFVRYRYNQLGYDENSPGFVNANYILNERWFSALLLLILSTVLFVLQTIPISLSAVIIILLLILSVFLIPRFAGDLGKRQAGAILFLLIINDLELMFWYLGGLLRYFLIFEVFLGMALSYFFLGLNWKKPKSEISPFIKNMKLISVAVFSLFAIAFFADIFGFVNLAAFLTKASAKIPATYLFVFLLYRILLVLSEAGCASGKNLKWHAAKYCENIERALVKILRLTAIFLFIEIILDVLEIYEPVVAWIKYAWVYDIAVGTFSISIGKIVGMIVIIVVSYFIANIFNVLFENSNYAKKNFSKGFLFAINKTVGYTIIITGFLLGFAYAGIDLGKFSLLAGALGVGIGFGLQNIVNNFISGLILLYERPVNVGDVISIGDLKGEVKAIGVRASKIRSFDGAEVIVPNGNIISNDLINWTLSDNKRRLEIRVGTEYGTDPNIVLKILQKVAVNHDKVLVEPAPIVLFDGFGDSSLDFRVLVWVYFDYSLSVKSELSIEIYNALNEAGIGIPFPQVDVHIKEPQTKKPEIIIPNAPDNSPKVVKNNDKE